MTAKAPHYSWFALQVRTRHEAGVASFLDALGFEHFLPLVTSRKRWSDRIKKVQDPLFPGYVFSRFDPQDRLPILKTPGVIQIVGYNRCPVPVDDSEISAIQTLIASGLPNQAWPFLSVGARVRIETGALRGYEGILIDFKGTHRLVLSISLLHRSVAVEIDSAVVSSIPAQSETQRSRTEAQLRPMRATA